MFVLVFESTVQCSKCVYCTQYIQWDIKKPLKYVYFSLDPVLKCLFYTSVIMTDMLQVLWILVNTAPSSSKDRRWTVQLHGQLDSKRKFRLSDGRHANKPPSKYLLYVSWLVVKTSVHL